MDIPDEDLQSGAAGAQSSVDLGPMSVAPEEELKMDKDLDLFEMINKGDFSTVGGQKGAPSNGTANINQAAGSKNDFDFDNFAAGGNGASKEAAGNSKD